MVSFTSTLALCQLLPSLRGVGAAMSCLTSSPLPYRTVMDEWQDSLRAKVITGCEARCSAGVVWRGALQLQEQLEARATCFICIHVYA